MSDEKIEQSLARARMEADTYSPRMQKILDGINRIRKEDPKMDKAISFFEKLSEENLIQIFYFGGFLRDAYLGFQPRDLDLVVNNEWELFQQKTAPFLVRQNRFGGLKLNVYETETDAWQVKNTDAFKRGVSYPDSANHLPETTIFNTESIILELWAPEGHYWGFERKFFDGCDSKTLEIVNPWNRDFQNEFAALQFCRIDRLQRKLKWKTGQELKNYIADNLPNVKLEDIKRFYESHYEEVCNPRNVIKHLKSLLDK